MHALVISGGGNKGAFAGGVAEYLIKDCGVDYDLFVGSSTGSLLLSHLALGEIDKIKKVFTSVRQKDIFNINPFIIRKRPEGTTLAINHFNTFRTFLLGRKTFGESKNLRKLLFNTLTEAEFLRLRELNEEIIVSVSNLTKCRTEFKSNLDCTYEEFINWVWASANYVPFMSLFVKDDCEYADGGFGTHTPIQAAIDRGATSIDVIVLETELMDKTVNSSSNAFMTLIKVFEHMTNQIYVNDIVIGTLKASINDVNISFFHLPRVISNLPLVFDPEEMSAWWEEGHAYAKLVNPHCEVIRKNKP